MLFSMGDVINRRYKINQLIGSGGFGEVYKVEDLSSGEQKALKCMLFEIIDEQPELVQLFDREVHAVMRVEHVNVVKIYSVEETTCHEKPVKFFTFEYAPNGDLEGYIKKQAAFINNEKLLSWISQLLSGLRAINKELIHRDLKPSNILIFGDVLKISDFGLSRLLEESTRTLTFKGWGTPSYMAPEVWENLAPTTAVDQYSMGLIFYVLSTLKHPFLPVPSSENIIEFLRESHLFKIPKQAQELNPDLPKKISSIIARMIEKKPENRYRNLNDIFEDLRNVKELEQKKVPEKIMEIVKIAKEAGQINRQEALKKAQERDRQDAEKRKIRKVFEFHCQELISGFNRIVGDVNEQLKPLEIRKLISKDVPFYSLSYNFSESQLSVYIEQVDGVNELEGVIGWGYCLTRKNEDGFNLILQRSKVDPYAKWLVLEVRDNPLYNFAKYIYPHGVQTLSELNEALRGLHVIHIYSVELKEFQEDMFLDLVKRLVSR